MFTKLTNFIQAFIQFILFKHSMGRTTHVTLCTLNVVGHVMMYYYYGNSTENETSSPRYIK